MYRCRNGLVAAALRKLFNKGKAFRQKYGYPLDIPRSWAQFRDVAEYFNGKDLNGDGIPDYGLSMHLKIGTQGMFHLFALLETREKSQVYAARLGRH